MSLILEAPPLDRFPNRLHLFRVCTAKEAAPLGICLWSAWRDFSFKMAPCTAVDQAGGGGFPCYSVYGLEAGVPCAFERSILSLKVMGFLEVIKLTCERGFPEVAVKTCFPGATFETGSRARARVIFSG